MIGSDSMLGHLVFIIASNQDDSEKINEQDLYNNLLL